MYRAILLAIIFLSFGSLAAKPLQPNAIDSLIAASDEFSTKTFENEKALDVLTKANAVDSNNYEILWRISRAYSDIG